METVIGVVFALGVFAIGLYALVPSVMNMARGRSSRAWPSVKGSVIASHLEWRQDEGDEYRTEVVYGYNVRGQEHRSNRLFFGDRGWQSLRRSAAARLRNYPKGATVRVWFNPESPGDSVLEPGIHPGLVFGAGFGLLMMAGVLWALFR